MIEHFQNLTPYGLPCRLHSKCSEAQEDYFALFILLLHFAWILPRGQADWDSNGIEGTWSCQTEATCQNSGVSGVINQSLTPTVSWTTIDVFNSLERLTVSLFHLLFKGLVWLLNLCDFVSNPRSSNVEVNVILNADDWVWQSDCELSNFKLKWHRKITSTWHDR